MIRGLTASDFVVVVLLAATDCIIAEPIPEPDQVQAIDGSIVDYEVEVMGPEEESALSQMAGKFIAPKCHQDGKMFNVKYQGSCYICGCFWDEKNSNYYSNCMKCRNCELSAEQPTLTTASKYPPTVVHPSCEDKQLGESFILNCYRCHCIADALLIIPICEGHNLCPPLATSAITRGVSTSKQLAALNYEECYGHQPGQIFPHPYIPCLLCTCVEYPAGIVHMQCDEEILLKCGPPSPLPPPILVSLYNLPPSDTVLPLSPLLESQQPPQECFGHYPGELFPHPFMQCTLCSCLEFPTGVLNLNCDEDSQCGYQPSTYRQESTPLVQLLSGINQPSTYRQPSPPHSQPISAPSEPQKSTPSSTLPEFVPLSPASQSPSFTPQECYGHNSGETFPHPDVECLLCNCLEYPAGVVHLSCNQNPKCTSNEPPAFMTPSILRTYSTQSIPTSQPTECYGHSPGYNFPHPFIQCLRCNCLDYPAGVVNLECEEDPRCAPTLPTTQPSPTIPAECSIHQPGVTFTHPMIPCLLCNCLEYPPGVLNLECIEDPRCTSIKMPSPSAPNTMSTYMPLQPPPSECNNRQPGEIFPHELIPCLLCTCLDHPAGAMNLDCDEDPRCNLTISTATPTPWIETTNPTHPECLGVTPGLIFAHSWKPCILCTCEFSSTGITDFHCWQDKKCDSTTLSSIPTPLTVTPNSIPAECIGVHTGSVFTHPWKSCMLCTCHPLSSGLIKFNCWSDSSCDSSTPRSTVIPWTQTQNLTPHECIGVTPGTIFAHSWKPCTLCTCELSSGDLIEFHCWPDNKCDIESSPEIIIDGDCQGRALNIPFTNEYMDCPRCICILEGNMIVQRCECVHETLPTTGPDPANSVPITSSEPWTIDTTQAGHNSNTICFGRSLQQQFAHPTNQCLDCTCIKINGKIDMHCLRKPVCGTDSTTISSWADVSTQSTMHRENSEICFQRPLESRFAHPMESCLVCTCVKLNGKLNMQCQGNPECDHQTSTANLRTTNWPTWITTQSTTLPSDPLCQDLVINQEFRHPKNPCLSCVCVIESGRIVSDCSQDMECTGKPREEYVPAPAHTKKLYGKEESHRCHYDGDIYHTKTGCKVCTCRKNTLGELYAICEGGCDDPERTRRNGRYSKNNKVLLHDKPDNTLVTEPLKLKKNITIFPDSTVMFDDNIVLAASGISARGKIKLFGDGSITVHNGNSKALLQPAGVIFMGGIIITADDTVVQPDGTIIGIDGRIVVPIPFGKDSVMYPDGSIRTDDGIVYKIDGNRIIPDGTVINIDGIVYDPNVMIKNKNGIIMGYDHVIKNPVHKKKLGVIRSDGILIKNEADFNDIENNVSKYAIENIMIKKPSGLTVFTNGTIEMPNGIHIKGNNIYLNNERIEKVEGIMISKNGRTEKFEDIHNRIFASPEKEEECFPLTENLSNKCQKCFCSWTGVTVRKECKKAACTEVQPKTTNEKLNEGEKIISRDDVETEENYKRRA